MEDKILSILEKSDKALSIEELDSLLVLDNVEKTKEFSDAIRNLEKDYKIYCSNKGRYMLLKHSNLRKGILKTNKKGYGFVETEEEEEDIFVSSDNLNKAINNDIVIVEIISNNKENHSQSKCKSANKKF